MKNQGEYKYKTRENSKMKLNYCLKSFMYQAMKLKKAKQKTRKENTTAIADVQICLRAFRIQG